MRDTQRVLYGTTSYALITLWYIELGAKLYNTKLTIAVRFYI